MQVIVKPTCEEMSIAAARILADAISAKPRLSCCLAAGKTPTGTYRELMRLHRIEKLDFSNATFFYLDEYAGLPADHPECFRFFLDREFFGPGEVKPENIHAPNGKYEETIRDCGGIDLLICGIGKNGHIAFNEPGTSVDSRTRIVDLAESTIEGLRGKFSPDEMPRTAITVGLATIMEARQILLLASGTEKAAILSRALKGPATTDIPASILQRHPQLTVLTDQEILSIAPPGQEGSPRHRK
jgi:glucosamine-6-phosphate deaminase